MNRSISIPFTFLNKHKKEIIAWLKDEKYSYIENENQTVFINPFKFGAGLKQTALLHFNEKKVCISVEQNIPEATPILIENQITNFKKVNPKMSCTTGDSPHTILYT